jgi:response regulator RpfG family c-di-GMP phosphodiesterase
MRILTIDDDMVNNLIMRENIKQIDPSIEVVEKMSLIDGILLLKSCKNKPSFPDFVFCDFNLPPFNAKDFIRVFNKFFFRQHPRTKIFIISAAVDNHLLGEIDEYEFVKGVLNKLDFDNHLRQILSGLEEIPNLK